MRLSIIAIALSLTAPALSLSAIAASSNPADSNAASENQTGTTPASDISQTTTDATTAASLKEIVVTATKRQEDVQRVPMSILPISGQALTDNQIFSVSDLSRAVPGFTEFHSVYQDARPTFSLRGVGTVSNGQLTQPSVGVVMDGVFIGRSGPAMSMLNFDDISELEVLRGPQGTLFGKNTTAGLLNVVTKSPTKDLQGNFSVSYGTYDDVRSQGFLSGPLVGDTVSASVAFYTHNMNGYTRNVNDGYDYNGSKSYGVHGKLLITPAEGTRILINADLEDTETECCALTVRYVDATSPLADQGLYPGLPNPFPLNFVGPENNEITGSDPLRRHTINRPHGISVTLEQDLGSGYQLTSITAYREWYATWDVPVGALGDTAIPFTLPTNLGTGSDFQFSEEARIASPKGGFFDYVAGVFYYRDHIFQTENFGIDLASLAGTPVGAVVDDGIWSSHGGGANDAAFVEGNLHFTGSLTLVMGARASRDTAFLRQNGHYIFGQPMNANVSHTVTLPSWRIGPQWQFNHGLMGYLTVAHSFKGSAYDDKSISPKGGFAEPEVATSYELGVKSTMLNNRLRVNGDIYLANYKDFQAQGVVLDASTNTLVEVLKNAGELRSKGVELDIDALLYRGLSVNVNGAYIDSRFVSFTNAPCYSGQPIGPGECSGPSGFQDLTGKPNALTPKFSYNGNANYEIDSEALPFDAFVSAGYAWRSSVEWDILQSPSSIEGSYGLLNASVGARSRDDRATLTLYGTNLTNKFHSGGYFNNEMLVPPDYKRLWGVRFDYKL